jgi:hypothetical protein
VRLRHCHRHVLAGDSTNALLGARREQVAVEQVRVREQEVRCHRLHHTASALRSDRRYRHNGGGGRLVVFLVQLSLLGVPPGPLLLVRDAAPKKGHAGEECTLVLPNWSRYRRNSSTCAPLHRDSSSGGRWLRRYCPNVCQSRRFCDSYRLGFAADAKPLPVLSAAAVTVDISIGHGQWCL